MRFEYSSTSVLMIAGPPLAGKGTLAERFMRRRGGCHHLDIRAELRRIKGTGNLPPEVSYALEAGQYPPDEFVVQTARKVMGGFLSQTQWVLNGVPGRPDQVRPILKYCRERGKTHFTAIILEVSDQELRRRRERSKGRRTGDQEDVFERDLRRYKETRFRMARSLEKARIHVVPLFGEADPDTVYKGAASALGLTESPHACATGWSENTTDWKRSS